MSKWVTRISTLLLIALISAAPVYANTSLRVIASFSVMEELVKRVAGDAARVNVIVPKGEDVHRWELTPPNVLALEETHIVFYNGLGLEPWIRHVEAMSDDQLTLVEVAGKADYDPAHNLYRSVQDEPDPAYVDGSARGYGLHRRNCRHVG